MSATDYLTLNTKNKMTQTALQTVINESALVAEKKNIVTGILNPFFLKADEWRSQVESLNITDPNDVAKMALAKAVRIQLKQMRLEAEKLVKEQRGIIKARMNDDVLEDKLWLHSGQIMEATFKNLETKAEEVEKFKERWDAEQAEKRKQERISKLSQFGAEPIPGLGEMSEESFSTYLKGVELAKAEADRKAKEEEEARIAEAERIRLVEIENQRLKAEADKAEAERRKAAQELEAQTKAAQEVQAKLDAIEKQKQVDILNKKKEEERMAKASESTRLKAFIDAIQIPPIDSSKYTAEGQAKIKDIQVKFEGFKKWAISQITA